VRTPVFPSGLAILGVGDFLEGTSGFPSGLTVLGDLLLVPPYGSFFLYSSQSFFVKTLSQHPVIDGLLRHCMYLLSNSSLSVSFFLYSSQSFFVKTFSQHPFIDGLLRHCSYIFSISFIKAFFYALTSY